MLLGEVPLYLVHKVELQVWGRAQEWGAYWFLALREVEQEEYFFEGTS